MCWSTTFRIAIDMGGSRSEALVELRRSFLTSIIGCLATTKVILVEITARIVNISAMNLLHSGDVSTASITTIEVLALGSRMVILVELRRSFPTSKIGRMTTMMVILVEV